MTRRSIFALASAAIITVAAASCVHNKPTLGVAGPDWGWASHLGVDSDYAVVLGIVTDSETGTPPDGYTEARITPAKYSGLHASLPVTRYGHFALFSIPGDNELEISAGTYFPKKMKLTLRRGGFDTVRIVVVPDKADHSQVPPPAYEFDQGGGAVVGIIIDSTTGRPLGNVPTVTLIPFGSVKPASSPVDSTGVFNFSEMPGSYRLLVRSPGYNEISRRVTIRPDTRDMLRLVMTREIKRPPR